jgi:Bpu10I restriction endonuclease
MFAHGDNLSAKEAHETKYMDPEAKRFLKEIRKKYDAWVRANNQLRGPTAKPSDKDRGVIEKRVALLNEYKDFIDQQKYAEKFDSRSNLHSTVIEEFLCYLFLDLAASFSKNAILGKAHTFKDLFFMPASFADMVARPNIRVEEKDHDFVIGSRILSSANVEGSRETEKHNFDVPAVAIECKTYLDKTMLESSSTSAEQLKTRNPNAIYVVVMEWIKLTENVNLKKMKVDQIYVLRKQRNTDREFRYLNGYKKNPIYADVVLHLYDYVRRHLCDPWVGGVGQQLEKGYLL